MINSLKDYLPQKAITSQNVASEQVKEQVKNFLFATMSISLWDRVHF